MKTQEGPKLRLEKLTLRELTQDDVENVGGATGLYCTFTQTDCTTGPAYTCYTYCGTCPGCL
jgi:hypothetical protein